MRYKSEFQSFLYLRWNNEIRIKCPWVTISLYRRTIQTIIIESTNDLYDTIYINEVSNNLQYTRRIEGQSHAEQLFGSVLPDATDKLLLK